MLAWVVDNANFVYLILGFVALALGVSWWLHRRVRTLFMLAGVAALIVVFWLITFLTPTDRKQLVANVWSMRRAVLDRKSDELAKHWSKDLTLQNFNRDELARAVTKAAADYQVNDIHIWDLEPKVVTEKTGEISFRCRVTGRDGVFLALCRIEFTKEDETWQARKIRFFQPIANTDQEIVLPIGR